LKVLSVKSNSKIVLGTVQFGLDYGAANKNGKIAQVEVKNIIALARKHGLNMLDTAVGYGDSEQVLGDADVTDFQIITKLPGLPLDIVNVQEWAFNQIAGSLSRLKASSIYAVLLHKPSDLFGIHGRVLADALLNFKWLGIVQKIGVSIYEPEELAELMPLIKIDLVQAPLNVIDRRLESTGWLCKLNELGVEVHTRSSFLQGLLLMNRKEIPEKFNNWSCMWDKWSVALSDSKSSALAACLAYPLSLRGINRVVVGVDSFMHLQEIIEASCNIGVDFDASFMESTDVRLINPSNWNAL
jgi:aryl-alcohol dehydrogenase-like predicted oxidoreductase